jgi:hypothetical protein
VGILTFFHLIQCPIISKKYRIPRHGQRKNGISHPSAAPHLQSGSCLRKRGLRGLPADGQRHWPADGDHSGRIHRNPRLTRCGLPRSKNPFPNFGTPRSGAIQSSDSYPQLFGNGPPAKPLAPQGCNLRRIVRSGRDAFFRNASATLGPPVWGQQGKAAGSVGTAGL